VFVGDSCISSVPITYAQCTPASLMAGSIAFLAGGVADIGDPGYAISYTQAVPGYATVLVFDLALGMVVNTVSLAATSLSCFEGTITETPQPGLAPHYGAIRICR
jgi:hypothetical protein